MAATGVQHEDSQGNRYYVRPDDKGKRPKRYPSVTRILDATWPSGGLENWKIGNIASKLIDDAEDNALKLLNIANRGRKFRELAKESWKEKLIEWKDDFTAANRGTRIHNGMEALYRKQTTTTQLERKMEEDEYEVIVNALLCIQEHGIEVKMMEIPVYGEAPYKYAGTADILAKIDGEYCVIDLKTGKRLNRSYIAQVAAYSFADRAYANGKMRKWPEIKRGFVLKSSPNQADLYEIDLKVGKEIFEACCLVYETSNTSGGMTLV